MLISTRHQALPDSALGTAPEWLHLVPAGTFKGQDGRGPFHLKNPAAFILNSMKGGNLPLDENHSTDLAGPNGQPSPARGWITELQARADGIWGRIEWNDSGKQLMADKAYRGISPVFTSDAKTGELQALLRAALTNTPNLGDLHTLHHQETGVDLTKLRKALGLADNADDAAILLAATTAHTAVTSHAQQLKDIAAAAGITAEKPEAAALVTQLQTQRTSVTAHASDIASIAAAAGITTAGVDAAAIVKQLQAQRAAAGDVNVMAQKVVTLETELNTLKATGSKDRAVAFIDGAITAGKPIASLRDHYITRHTADAVAVEKEINALVSINAGGIVRKSPMEEGGEDELTTEEMAVCEKMGQDPKAFAKNKAAMAKKKVA